jgi:hypothetical protein
MRARLTSADHKAIAREVVRQMDAGTPWVLTIREAMKKAGFTSAASFHRWAKRMNLRSVKGARGRYAASSLTLAIQRASLGSFR